MREDVDEGLSVCPCVCLGRRKCRHCLLTFRLRGPLTATADFFSLCRSYCNCLRVHNGALSVLRQMLLVCLVNMGAKEHTSPSLPCAALTATTTTTTTLQIRIRESHGDTENLPESHLGAFRSHCHRIPDKMQFCNCMHHIVPPSVYKVWCCNSELTSCDVTKGSVNSPSVPGIGAGSSLSDPLGFSSPPPPPNVWRFQKASLSAGSCEQRASLDHASQLFWGYGAKTSGSESGSDVGPLSRGCKQQRAK